MIYWIGIGSIVLGLVFSSVLTALASFVSFIVTLFCVYVGLYVYVFIRDAKITEPKLLR